MLSMVSPCSKVCIASCFIYQLARHMIRSYLEAENVLADFGDLIICVICVVGKLGTETDADLPDLIGIFRIFEKSDAAEYDDTPDVQRPVVTFSIALVHYTERDLVACFDSIQFMSCLGSMKVDLTIRFIVPVADRKPVS